MDWQTISDTDDHIIIGAETDVGDWQISTIKDPKFYGGELWRDVRLSLRPAHPTMELRELLDYLYAKDERPSEEERKELFRYTRSSEIGNFQGWTEAVVMAEMLAQGNRGSLVFETLLKEAGWTLRWEHTYEERGVVYQYEHHALKNLSLGLVPKEGRIDLDLANSRGHYNIGSLYTSYLKMDFPPGVGDFRIIFLLWMQRIIGLRQARGGLFRKPLAEEDVGAIMKAGE